MFPFTLHQLRILKAIAMEQSFTKAASGLSISQPSLSKHISVLEKNLGIKLIKRQTNKIFLTKNGKVLLKYSERILALCEESCRVLTKSDKKKEEELRVGLNQPLGDYLVPKLLGICNQTYSQLNLKIVVDSTEKIAKQILSHKLDITLASEEIYDFLNEDATIKMEHYVNDRFSFILSNSHQLAKQSSIDKTDLYNLNYITLESNNVGIDHINKLLFINHVDIYQFKTVIQLDSLESVKTAVKLGLGVSFVSSLAIEKEIELKMIKVMKVHKIKIDQKLFIINTLKRLDSRAFKIFYNKLLKFKQILLNKG